MSLKEKLQEHFGETRVLYACKRLVEEVFPDCSASSKARDVFALAQSAGIEIRHQDTQFFDGMFQSDESGAVVTLSTLAGRRRKRFTLAHEIGHWLLRENGTTTTFVAYRGSPRNSTNDRDEEEVANLLAAELLMPIDAIVRRVTYSKMNMALIENVAKSFDVSFNAALRRMADVTGAPMLYLNVVPHRFNDLSSYAEVDEAIYISPMTPAKMDRENTRLVRKYRYDEILKAKQVRLGVRGSFGRVLSNFEVRRKFRPIPNCELLTTLAPGLLRPR